MADVGDDLLDGDLDETSFGELDGEEEDALLADDDYEPYQSTRRTVFSGSTEQGERHTELFHIVDQVQDVSEGDEIIEDGDVLELAVVDELDESELDNGQLSTQTWPETSTMTVDSNTNGRGEPGLGVTSSTSSMVALGGESDEEESDGRGSRFKTERTNIISLKGVSSGKSLNEIPDSLDNVKTPVPSSGMRRGGPMQRGGKGSIRGRLGPIQRGPMMRGSFGPMRRPQAPPPGHKIHVNPHFRGGMHQSQPVWDNERLPPPPGCESFNSPVNQDNWMGPMPHHMGKPPFPPQHPPPGPPVQYQNMQMYTAPQQPQGCEDQYNPMMNTNTPHPNNPNRIVQFSESCQLVTVENQHFQRPSCDQNCGPVNNQFPPHQNVPPHYNNNNTFPNQFNHSQPRPNFPPQPFPVPHSPQNYHGYPPQEYHPLHSNPPQFQNFENNMSSPPQTMNDQQNQWAGPHSHPQHQPPWFCDPQPQFPPRPPFQQQNFRPPIQNQVKRGMGVKRLVPRQPLNNSVSPVKQMRFEHTKPRTAPSNIRSNLQEIKTVDNLPDTTTTQEPEPEIEEDEETKQYRLKIAEQKALREKILKEKEARRLAAIIEKQNKQENLVTNLNTTSPSGIKPVCVQKTQPQPQPPQRQQPPLQRQQPPLQRQQPPPQRQQPPPQRQQAPSQRQHPPPQRQPQTGPGRGRGRGRNPPSLNRQPMKPLAPGAPVVQIQQMLGTMYKIVKVRTKEGAIVTRKTPLVMNSTGTVAAPMKTVSSTAPATSQRRVVLPQASTKNIGNMGRGGGGGGNTVRMISASQTPQGRTLFTVQTTPMSTQNKVQGPPRVVIDKRPFNTTMKIVATATPSVPVSTLVTVDNLSLSTSQAQIQKLAKQVGSLSSIKHEPELKRATLRFKNPKEAERFFLKFHRKMIDLSRISVTVVPE